MGGGGSIAGMITSLKKNSRRKIHAPFSKNKTYKTKKESLEDYNFLDATPEQLKIIKENLKAYNRRVFITSTLITVVFIAILIYIFLIIKV